MTDKALDARLVVRRGEFELDVPLEAGAGETIALLGPNGAGKSTALRAVAGLLPLSEGHVAVGGREFDRPETDVWVPPQDRTIGVVFQEYLLFPHMTALDNAAFGPRRKGKGKAEARAIARRALERVGLADFADRKPRRLSGGQAQRVALARALALEPTLLLLDEPLAALDAATRLETRAELHRQLGEHEGAAVLVTHDPIDALILADRLLVIEDGRVVQSGSGPEITSRPRTEYVAKLVGLNLFAGTGEGTAVRIGGGFPLEGAEKVDGPVFAAFPPSAVALYPQRPEGSPRNTWEATVTSLYRHGDSLRVNLTGPVDVAADVTPAAAGSLALEPGLTVWASVKAQEVHVYPD